MKIHLTGEQRWYSACGKYRTLSSENVDEVDCKACRNTDLFWREYQKKYPQSGTITFTFDQLDKGLRALLGPEFRAEGPLNGLYEPSFNDAINEAFERFGWDEPLTIELKPATPLD